MGKSTGILRALVKKGKLGVEGGTSQGRQHKFWYGGPTSIFIERSWGSLTIGDYPRLQK